MKDLNRSSKPVAVTVSTLGPEAEKKFVALGTGRRLVSPIIKTRDVFVPRAGTFNELFVTVCAIPGTGSSKVTNKVQRTLILPLNEAFGFIWMHLG